MYDSASISVLLKLLAVVVLAMPVVWKTRYPEVSIEGMFVLTFLAFVAGGLCTTAYMLVRYKKQLTPEVKE